MISGIVACQGAPDFEVGDLSRIWAACGERWRQAQGEAEAASGVAEGLGFLDASESPAGIVLSPEQLQLILEQFDRVRGQVYVLKCRVSV